MRRLHFRRSLLGLGAGCALNLTTTGGGGAAAQPPPGVLLRSSWQTVNIGDIGHTPGVLRLLEEHLPGLQVILWPCNVDRGVEPMLRRGFPQVQIVKGNLDGEGRPTTPELQAAFDRATFLLHGSGPSVVRSQDVAAWRRVTGKPYGIYGVTMAEVDEALRELLSAAEFVFCRDTISLQLARDRGVTCPVLEFGPDGAFGFHLRDDEQALAFLQQQGLIEGQFLCAIPRLRYTPYHEVHGTTPRPLDLERAEYSASYREADHAKLREAICRWVRETGLKVLLCPEMTYQVELGRREVLERLPEDVRAQVVWRDRYWLPDEAASVYARARALVSFELHSPIMAVAAGTPAVYLRQPTDTCKGQMWRDVGLQPWIFEIEETSGEAIGETLLGIHRDHEATRQRLEQAMSFVRGRQRATMAVLGKILSG